MLYVNSFRFKAIAAAVEEASFEKGICINLNFLQACANERVVDKEYLTGDYIISLQNMQDVASLFADIDVVNY